MIKFENLKLQYKTSKLPYVVLEGFSVNILKGEIVSLFGENGTGKSSLFNFIAGFKENILKSNLDCNFSTFNIGYVVQNSEKSLFEWKSPLENIIFPIESNDNDFEAALRKAKSLCDSFGFNMNWGILTKDLSGGQKQKLAILRELFKKPELLLIDEGFVSIDYRTRNKTILKLRDWVKNNDTTIINISHHIEEAVLISDRILILSEKKIKDEITIQIQEPREISIRNKQGDYSMHIENIKSKFI